MGIIDSVLLNEISGMVSGRINPDILWVHNDSGDENRIYAVGMQANLLGIYTLTGAQNRDWEDIAIGPGPRGRSFYIYIGDIGDNNAEYPVKFIYRVPEPVVPRTPAIHDSVLSDCISIGFTYPDGPRDAECLLVDPLNADIYVLSKRDAQTHVYFAPYPQPTDSIFEIQKLGTITITGITAGDIAPNGDFIILKNYNEVFLWHRRPNDSVFETLCRKPERLPYVPEAQGEAIAWEFSGSGYITTSEVIGGIPAQLIHYDFNP